MLIAFQRPAMALKAHMLFPESKVIPTPRDVSNSCSLSLDINGDKDKILARLTEAGITWSITREKVWT